MPQQVLSVTKQSGLRGGDSGFLLRSMHVRAGVKWTFALNASESWRTMASILRGQRGWTLLAGGVACKGRLYIINDLIFHHWVCQTLSASAPRSPFPPHTHLHTAFACFFHLNHYSALIIFNVSLFLFFFTHFFPSVAELCYAAGWSDCSVIVSAPSVKHSTKSQTRL